MNFTALALLLAALAPQNPYDKLKLTVQRAVYTVDGPDTVKVTLQNIGGTTLSSPSSWSVHDVYAPLSLTLKPWEWATYTWDKKDRFGKTVPPGSYRIQAGPTWNGTRWETQAATVALTPSGRIAGSKWFPLAVGNSWYYTGERESNELYVDYETFGWSHTRGEPLWNLSLKYWGAPFSTLYVWSGMKANPLFRFGRVPGTEWSSPTPSMKRLRVGATDVAVVTPVGTFPGCYRIDVIQSVPWDGREFRSLWFHPGVGLVAYRLRTPTYESVLRLRRAKIRGSDGRWYTLDRY